MPISESLNCIVTRQSEDFMRMRTGSSYPFCTKKVDRTRAGHSYWTALVVTCTWQSFYVNEERFYCLSNVESKGCVLHSKKKHGYLQSLEFAVCQVKPCP